jgi:type IV secretory pathway TrbD component
MPANDETRVEELPPDETGQVPVTHVAAEPRWYGITPRGGALAVGIAAAGVGIVLLVLGSTIAGAILLAVGALMLGMLVRSDVASVLSGPTARGRTAVSTRLSAGRRLATLRRDLDELSGERDRRLRALGEAVYRGDDAALDPLRQELVDLDRREAEIREEIDRTTLDAQQRMSDVQLETARTQVVRPEPEEQQEQ